MDLTDRIKQTAKERIETLRAGMAKRSLTRDLFGPMKHRREDQQSLKPKLQKIKSVHKILVGLLKELKSSAPDVTAQTEICAVYLLYGTILQLLDDIYLLAESGSNYSMMSLCRVAMEAIDLIRLFHRDKTGKYLKDWFDCKIIGNEAARETISKDLTASGIDLKGIDPEKLSSDLYRGYSHYPHLSYAAILDTIDPYSLDLDWSKNAGIHWADHNFKMVDNVMASLLIAFKATYQKLGYLDKYQLVDEVLRANYGAHDAEELDELATRIKNS